jgi:hypothetical protein
MRILRLAASSGVMLVTSISALSVSPNADCTASRPSPIAQESVDPRESAATATLVRANRPSCCVVFFKASPNQAVEPSCSPTRRSKPSVTGDDHEDKFNKSQ